MRIARIVLVLVAAHRHGGLVSCGISTICRELDEHEGRVGKSSTNINARPT